MKINLFLNSLIFICLFNVIHAFSQAPLVKLWDYRYGGTYDEVLANMHQTVDGGYIMGGWSSSDSSGDITQHIIGNYADFWIIKLNTLGLKEWDRRFGGYDIDYITDIELTADGGYIMAGSSTSDSSGDFSHHSRGYFDYWIVKADSLGNKQWDMNYGGNDRDELNYIQQTRDKGYIIGGYSTSGIGGDKTQNNWDPTFQTNDYWVIKTDSLGKKKWDKTFGGKGDEWFYCLQQTFDGGYILGGTSYSGIGGNKTQASRDTSSNYYWKGDFWVVKIDSLGNKQWDSRYGGFNADRLYSLLQTPDSGYILAGYSNSDIGGDKTEHNRDISTFRSDYWIVKIDAAGNKIWDKTFGGIFEDGGNAYNERVFGQIKLTSDKGYLISGSSTSDKGGDKSENNYDSGYPQTWIIKTDSLGNKLWDRTMLNRNMGVICGYAIESKDGCYVIADAPWADYGGYKTQDRRGRFDLWVIKFCDTSKAVLPVLNFKSDREICLDPEASACLSFNNLSLKATSYQWLFPGAIPSSSTTASPSNICYSASGVYPVTLIASNTNGSDTLTANHYLTVYPPLTPPAITHHGDTLFATTGYLMYQWYYNGTRIPWGVLNYFVGSSAGTYSVVVTDNRGCQARVDNIIVNTDMVQGANGSLNVYPNPAQDKLWINGVNSSISVTIYNVVGEIQPNGALTKDDAWDIKAFLPGIYFIRVTNDKGSYVTRFIKL